MSPTQLKPISYIMEFRYALQPIPSFPDMIGKSSSCLLMIRHVVCLHDTSRTTAEGPRLRYLVELSSGLAARQYPHGYRLVGIASSRITPALTYDAVDNGIDDGIDNDIVHDKS